MGQKKKGFVLLLSIMVMVLAMAMPNDVEAARKKKPAVKTVELRVGGKKVNGKTVTVKQGSKTKVSVVVKPGNAKKSVKWSKLSSKSKKIATISKSGVISAKKKNGTVKMTVTVKGKNGKSKKAWFKVKVVKSTVKKPATTKPATPSKPSTPSIPSKPSTPTTTGKSYTVRLRGVGGDVHKASYTEGTVLNLNNFVDTTNSDSSYKFAGWYTGTNGRGSKVTSWKVTGNVSLYAYLVKKDINKDWNPTFVQGDGSTLDTSLPIYDNDGVKTYNEMVTSYSTDANIVCDCGKACQFKVKDHKGRVIVVDKFLFDAPSGRCYLLTGAVQSTRTLSSDWAYLEITNAVYAVKASNCSCNNIWNFRGPLYDGSHSATFKR